MVSNSENESMRALIMRMEELSFQCGDPKPVVDFSSGRPVPWYVALET